MAEVPRRMEKFQFASITKNLGVILQKILKKTRPSLPCGAIICASGCSGPVPNSPDLKKYRADTPHSGKPGCPAMRATT
jgi:hypothetical protein